MKKKRKFSDLLNKVINCAIEVHDQKCQQITIYNNLVLQPVSSYPTNRSSFPKSFIGNPYSAIDSR